MRVKQLMEVVQSEQRNNQKLMEQLNEIKASFKNKSNRLTFN